MTTARARFLNYSLGGCLSGLDRGGLRRIPLGDGPVNDPDDEDDGEGELVDRDVPDCAAEPGGPRPGALRRASRGRGWAPTAARWPHPEVVSRAPAPQVPTGKQGPPHRARASRAESR